MVGKSHVQSWATAISTNSQNGRKIIFRYAKDFSSTFDRASQPSRIIIVWKYDFENGQLESGEHRRMKLLENSLEPILDQDDFATLALVTTGENLREWTYYAKSDEAFIQRLNLVLAGLPVFPIEIHTARDPTWSMYEEFKLGVKETAH
jgi:Family of unknown function (DUF695)